HAGHTYAPTDFLSVVFARKPAGRPSDDRRGFLLELTAAKGDDRPPFAALESLRRLHDVNAAISARAGWFAPTYRTAPGPAGCIRRRLGADPTRRGARSQRLGAVALHPTPPWSRIQPAMSGDAL